MEGPGEWAENLRGWTNEFKGVGGGSLPAVSRDRVEIMAMVDPNLERTVISKRAVDHMGGCPS
jgi:hypothetical protein